MMAKSIVGNICQTRVSSVLNKDVKQFGKKYLFDSDNETCWNSDQGCPQWVAVTFNEPVVLAEIHLHFQGGFVGKECRLEGTSGQQEMKSMLTFSPQDTSQLQTFSISDSTPVDSVKMVFEDSTDFFGRITLYKLDFIGSPCS